MAINILAKASVIRVICFVTCLMFICCSATFSAANDGLEVKADELLKSMSTFLGNTKQFTVDTDIDFEIVTSDALKLQISTLAKVSIKRPSKLHIERIGMDADVYLLYDGETLTFYGVNTATYGQLSGTGTIDSALMVYQMETGLAEPGAGLLLENSYDASQKIREAVHILELVI